MCVAFLQAFCKPNKCEAFEIMLPLSTFSHDDKRIPFNRWKLVSRERAIKFDSPYCKKKILAEK